MFEYRLEYGCLIERLNILGNEGWEHYLTLGDCWYFKRHKSQKAEKVDEPLQDLKQKDNKKK